MFSKTDQEIFYRAVESRDYRFDGRFFTGVKTTGIYCRPVCPAKPLRKNIVFFKTAHIAEREGYRPCLRCRPEVAPQSPAWIGKSAIVKRAITLISEGQLFLENETGFAAKLGVSERHLRRLSNDEIGLTAKQVSDAQRLNFSRTLVVETNIPITEIAFTSGFNSVRRFNDAFQRKFSKKPMEVRKRKALGVFEGTTNLYLRYRPPFDWTAILDYLKSHSTPGVEAVVNESYHRLFVDEQTKKPALAIVSNQSNQNCLKLELFQVHTKSLFALSRKVRKMFDLDSDPILIANAFSKSKFLTKIYNKNPGMRIPCGWNAFETSVSTILGQFVTVENGRRMMQQLVFECGTPIKHDFDSPVTHVFPSLSQIEKSPLNQVKTTNQRKEAIRELARRLIVGEIDLSESCNLNLLRSSLSKIKGIGPWTVEYICLMAIGDTNAFPAKDLILSRVLELHPEVGNADMEPWRSYLALYLWREFAKKYSNKWRNKNVG